MATFDSTDVVDGHVGDNRVIAKQVVVLVLVVVMGVVVVVVMGVARRACRGAMRSDGDDTFRQAHAGLVVEVEEAQGGS